LTCNDTPEEILRGRGRPLKLSEMIPKWKPIRPYGIIPDPEFWIRGRRPYIDKNLPIEPWHIAAAA